jgi:hypothetical protein
MSFIKSKKQAAAPDASLQSKLTLPQEHGLRDLNGIKEMLELANERRGYPVELSWTTNKPEQIFTLVVQWDKTAVNPVWTLYETNQAESTTVWTQPFSPGEMDFMYDVLAFAGGGAAGGAKIPDDLKPVAAAVEPEEPAKSASVPTKAPATVIPPPPAPIPTSQAPAQPEMQPPVYQQPVPMAGYPQPVAYPYPPGYGAPPGMPYPVNPYGQPMMPQPPYPPPPPNWAYSTGTNIPALPAAIDPVAEMGNASRSSDMLEKVPGILIGSLLTQAELITEPTLEAALKIQDLVKIGRISVKRAPEILKMLFSMGSSIEDYIDPADFLPAKRAQFSEPRAASPSSSNTSLPSVTSYTQSSKEMEAYKLLLKAGLLQESDIKMADQVKAKHGGDLKSILLAAGKVDSKTIDAAVTCTELERSGKMKVEKCIIALNYCSRSRVTLDEALDELGWENPRSTPR